MTNVQPVTRALPEEIVRGITHLDPLPATARRLLGMLRRDEEESFGRLADVLERDQAMVASLLRRANSAGYASSPTLDVREAMVRVGTVTLLDLVLKGHLRQLVTAVPAYGLGEDDLWMHSVAAQCAVGALRAAHPRLDIPWAADVGALLHDIGKLLVARYLRVDASYLIEQARELDVTYTEAERRTFGFDHTAIGAAIADHWGLPADVVFTIRHHHDSAVVGASSSLDAVVMANLVAKTVGTGLGAEGLNFSVDASTHQRLGMTFELFGQVCLATQEALAEVTGRHS